MVLYGLVVIGLPLLGLLNALLYSVGLAGPFANGFTMTHWQKLSTEAGLFGALGYSLYIALVSIGLAVLLALAIVLRTRKSASNALTTVLYIPLLFPALVVAFYLFQLLSGAGWLSRILFRMGLVRVPADFPELIQDTAGVGIILAHVLMAFPFFTLLFQTIFADAQLADYRHSTLTLGATETQFRRRVAVPILLRRAAPTLVLYGVAVLGAYDIPLLLGRSYPQMVSVFITTRLQRFNLAELPLGYGAGFVVAVLLLTIIGLMVRTTRNYAQ